MEINFQDQTMYENASVLNSIDMVKEKRIDSIYMSREDISYIKIIGYLLMIFIRRLLLKMECTFLLLRSIFHILSIKHSY